jgi:hypothetical protein
VFGAAPPPVRGTFILAPLVGQCTAMRAVITCLSFTILAASTRAHAQSVAAAANDTDGTQPPIVITSSPETPSAPAPEIAVDPMRPVVSVHIVSDGEPVRIGFVPYFTRVPREDEMSYVCRTPCDVPIPAGTYHLVARGSSGRLHRLVDVGRDARFSITPPRSRAPSLALTIVGGVSLVAALSVLLIGAELSALYGSYYAYSRPDLTGYWVAGTVLGLGGLATLLPGVVFLRGTGGQVRSGPNGDPVRETRMPLASAMIVPLAQGGALGLATLRF